MTSYRIKWMKLWNYFKIDSLNVWSHYLNLRDLSVLKKMKNVTSYKIKMIDFSCFLLIIWIDTNC